MHGRLIRVVRLRFMIGPARLLEPGPAGLVPPPLLFIAASLGKGQEPRPGDRLGIDLEGFQVHLVRAQFVVEGEARPVVAQPECLRRHFHFGRRGHSCRCNRHLGRKRHAQCARHVARRLGMHLLMQGHQPEEIEFGVAGVAGKLHPEGPGSAQECRPGTGGWQPHPAAAAPSGCGGPRSRSRRRSRRRAAAMAARACAGSHSTPQSALAVAPYPVLLEPADMAQFP